MARIFISYSRADAQFMSDFVPHLREIFSDHSVWYDKHISGGQDWWQRILQEIAACDLFIYLLSNESLASKPCNDEFREALRLRKRCLPIIVRPKTDVARAPNDVDKELHARQWIDMSGGLKDHHALAALYTAVRELAGQVPVPAVSRQDVPAIVRSPAERTTHNRQIMIIGSAMFLLAFCGLTAFGAVVLSTLYNLGAGPTASLTPVSSQMAQREGSTDTSPAPTSTWTPFSSPAGKPPTRQTPTTQAVIPSATTPAPTLTHTPTTAPTSTYPDLAANITYAPLNPTTNDTIAFTVTVLNRGTAPSDPTTTTIRVGGETTGTSHSIPALGPGQSAQVVRQQRLDVAQNYLVSVTVDPANAVPESTESNNTASAPFTVTQAGSPDLTIASVVHTPANPRTTDTITFTVTVLNAGTAPAGATTVTIRVGGETTGKSYAIPALAPGQSAQVTRQQKLTVAQNYLTNVSVDPGNQVMESSETNNTQAHPFTVTQ